MEKESKPASTKSNKRILTVFALAMINVSLICSLRGLPMMAEYGLSIVALLLLAVLVFFIPTSLISAELATGWPKKGGIYAWVKQAFGEKWGFVAIWIQWSQNLAFYPTALAAAAATIAFIFMPILATSKIFTVVVVIIVYWGATFLNFKGLKFSAMLSKYGAVFGIIVPGAVIMIATAVWLALGNPSQIAFTTQALIPDLSSMGSFVFFAGIVLYFAGMEVSAVHAKEVKDPQKNFPKAILLSALIIIAIFVLGSLSVAIIVPQAQISLTAGVMETLAILFTEFNMLWVIPLIALLAAPGMVAQISSWIAGPSKGLLACAQQGNLPKFFQQTNKQGVQTHILIFQGCIVTGISMVFLLMPTVSSGFWILSALAVQLYLVMYIIMFAAAIKLRYSEPNTPRPFKVPGGIIGMWLIGGLGLVTAIGTILIGFYPPNQFAMGDIFFFESFLLGGILIIAIAPLVIHRYKKPSWMPAEIK